MVRVRHKKQHGIFLNHIIFCNFGQWRKLVDISVINQLFCLFLEEEKVHLYSKTHSVGNKRVPLLELGTWTAVFCLWSAICQIVKITAYYSKFTQWWLIQVSLNRLHYDFVNGAYHIIPTYTLLYSYWCSSRYESRLDFQYISMYLPFYAFVQQS